MELLGAFTDAVDARLFNNRGRTDLGETAQAAGVEALAHVLGGQVGSLFEATTEQVRQALGQLCTARNFGALARRFFSRLTFKALDYFLSRALAEQVGEGRRFTTLAQQAEFLKALETYCHDAAYDLRRFSGEWASKERWEQGDVSEGAAARLVGGAMAKLIQALKREADRDGQ
jgi:hypothetical protein